MNKLTMRKISAGIVCAAVITAAFPGCAQKTESASSSSVNDSSSVSEVITESSEPESVPDVEAEEQTEDTAAVEETDEVKAFLSDIAGTYIGLFEPVTFKDEYSSLWHDYCAAIVGEDTADTWADMMKYSIGGKLYGSEAVEAYNANPEQTQFCCEYINDVERVTFDGHRFSGVDKDGSELFSHEYSYIGNVPIGADEGIVGFEGYGFVSEDSDSGEFTYFVLMPDTPASTYHMEFRYGSDLEELKKYAE